MAKATLTIIFICLCALPATAQEYSDHNSFILKYHRLARGVIILLNIEGEWRHYMIKNQLNIVATAYSSEASQTDADPCYPAAWRPNRNSAPFNLCEANREDVIAVNGLPFWSKVLINCGNGWKLYTVVDRMNARYPNLRRVDFWKRNRRAAVNFGTQRCEMILLQRVRLRHRTLIAQQ